jgi:phage terminase large subunit-like protein
VGKSFSLLLEPLRHVHVKGFDAVIFRRTSPEITNAGGLWDESYKIYPALNAHSNASDLKWFFPPYDNSVHFAHMEHEKDRFSWLGAQVALIEFDELTSFTEEQFFYMLSRNRTTCGVRPYIRASTNPDADSWVAQLIAWWINQETGFPIPERAGVLRWFLRLESEFVWADTAEELHRKYPDIPPKSLTFVPGLVYDNVILMKSDPGYIANLYALPLVERARLLEGNWKIRPSAGLVFSRDNFQVVLSPPQVPVLARIRYWDKAGTEGGGAYTAGVRMARTLDGQYVVEDVVRGQWSSLERNKIMLQTALFDGINCQIWVEQEPGPIWEEEPIQMADGTRKLLKEVVVGDWVIGGDGNATAVSGAHDRGLLETVAIQTDSGRTVHAALDHPFFTPKGWILARDLAVGDVLALRAGVKIEPASKPTLEECRLAGYFVGDGCCTNTKNGSCNANVVSSDPTLGEDIIRCGESIGASVHVSGSRGWTYYMSKSARSWLRERGLAGKGTDNKNIPEWVLSADDERVANFIGAFFACDGGAYATSHHKDIVFHNTNRRLLEEIQSVLLRFGVYSMLRVRKYQPHVQRGRRAMYRLTMRSRDDSMAKFSERVPVFGVKGKPVATFKRIAFDQPLLPDRIVGIISSGLKPCRCLTVSGDVSSFLVRDLVVHNSGGKESAEASVRNLAGFTVRIERVTGDKETRAAPFSAQVEAHNVYVVQAAWTKAFIDEHDGFPVGRYKDQVDAASGAFNKLAGALIIPEFDEALEMHGDIPADELGGSFLE